MKISTLRNKIFTVVIIMVIWHLLSKIYPPIIIPTIGHVIKAIIQIISDRSLIKEIFATLIRLLTGLSLGLILSIIVTLIVSRFKVLEEMLFPVVQFLQVIPPISWLVLAILWLGINGKPAIFIVAISIFCIMTISLVNAVKNIDKKLLEIATVFKLGRIKKWRHIIFPSLYPAFENSFMICLGISVKLIVMAEVLTINEGIGGGISSARVNLETEGVIAWTIITLVIFYFLGGLFKWLQKRKCIRQFWYRSLLPKSIMKN